MMTEEQKRAAALSMADSIRKQLHQLVDQKIDSFILTVLLDDQKEMLQTDAGKLLPLSASPAAFKGTKPAAVIFPDGRALEARTWKQAAATLLTDCAGDPQRHEKMMYLRGRVSGNFRMLISKSSSGMKAPLKIDEDLYVEGKFDTEALLRNITEKIFDRVGYEYRDIMVQCREPRQEMASPDEGLICETGQEQDGESQFGGMQLV